LALADGDNGEARSWFEVAERNAQPVCQRYPGSHRGKLASVVAGFAAVRSLSVLGDGHGVGRDSVLLEIPFVTEQTSQWLADVIAHSVESDIKGYFEVSITDVAETYRRSYWIRPRPDGVVTLADGQEIVQCVSKANEKIDLVLGRPDEREFRPAGMIV
jgi:hypothetical protein